jgi:hypothetical protein
LLALGVMGAALLVLAASRGGAGAAAHGHTCGPGDHQFVQAAALTKGSLWLWQQELGSGDTSSADLVAETDNAAQIVGASHPTDPSLKEARSLLVGMFGEYGAGVAAKANGDASSTDHFLRAFTLANFWRQVLVNAEPQLARLGCDVAPLVA